MEKEKSVLKAEEESDEQRIVLQVHTIGIYKTEERAQTPPALNLSLSRPNMSKPAIQSTTRSSGTSMPANPITQGGRVLRLPIEAEHSYANPRAG